MLQPEQSPNWCPSGLDGQPHRGLAVDGAGNVSYFADFTGNNALIKEWIAANNTVTALVSSASGLNR